MAESKPETLSMASSSSDTETSRSQQPAVTKTKSITFGNLPAKIDTAESNRRASRLMAQGDEEKAEGGSGDSERAAAVAYPFPQSPFPWQPRGYPRLAMTMATEPSLAIFRRFGRLNALNLLAMQAELLGLETEYEAQLRADDLSSRTRVHPTSSSSPADGSGGSGVDGNGADGNGVSHDSHVAARDFSTDFWAMEHAPAPSDGQRRILERIRPKLAAYNAALAQAADLERLARPLDGNVENLRGWLESPDYGDDFLQRAAVNAAANANANANAARPGWPGDRGYDHARDTAVHARTYDPVWRDDFVTVMADRPGEGRLAKLLNPRLLRWYHRHVEPNLGSGSRQNRRQERQERRWDRRSKQGRHGGRNGESEDDEDVGNLPESGSAAAREALRRGYRARARYLDSRDSFRGWVATALSLGATLLASLLPVVTVLILFYLPSVQVRIAATIAFTVAFGLLLALCTNSSLKEIFSACIAFAGLEVVFIGTNGVG